MAFLITRYNYFSHYAIELLAFTGFRRQFAFYQPT